MFCDAMYREAGVDDDGLAHPSTWFMYDIARKQGQLRPEPVPGGFIIWTPGAQGHVEIAVNRIGPGVWRTIGGNTGDAVREHNRSIAGAYFSAPSALSEVAKPTWRTEYGWQDFDAEPVMHGPWATEAYRERGVAAWVAKHGNPGHVRRGKLVVGGKTGYVFWTGQRARSPWFSTKRKRDTDLAKIKSQRPGHRFRTLNRRVQA